MGVGVGRCVEARAYVATTVAKNNVFRPAARSDLSVSVGIGGGSELKSSMANRSLLERRQGLLSEVESSGLMV